MWPWQQQSHGASYWSTPAQPMWQQHPAQSYGYQPAPAPHYGSVPATQAYGEDSQANYPSNSGMHEDLLAETLNWAAGPPAAVSTTPPPPPPAPSSCFEATQAYPDASDEGEATSASLAPQLSSFVEATQAYGDGPAVDADMPMPPAATLDYGAEDVSPSPQKPPEGSLMPPPPLSSRKSPSAVPQPAADVEMTPAALDFTMATQAYGDELEVKAASTDVAMTQYYEDEEEELQEGEEEKGVDDAPDAGPHGSAAAVPMTQAYFDEAPTNEPSMDETAMQQPTVEELAVQQPPVERPAAEEPAVEEAAGEEAAMEAPTAEEVMEEPAGEAAAMEEPPKDAAVVEEPAMEEPPKDAAVVEEPAMEEPPKDAAVVEEPAMEEPPKDAAVVEEPAMEDPPKDAAVVEEPAMEEPSKDAAVVEEPAIEGPSVDASIAEDPAVEAPVVEESAMEEPAETLEFVEPPKDVPSVQEPALEEEPAVEEVEQPVVEEQSKDAPIVEESVVDPMADLAMTQVYADDDEVAPAAEQQDEDATLAVEEAGAPKDVESAEAAEQEQEEVEKAEVSEPRAAEQPAQLEEEKMETSEDVPLVATEAAADTEEEEEDDDDEEGMPETADQDLSAPADQPPPVATAAAPLGNGKEMASPAPSRKSLVPTPSRSPCPSPAVARVPQVALFAEPTPVAVQPPPQETTNCAEDPMDDGEAVSQEDGPTDAADAMKDVGDEAVSEASEEKGESEAAPSEEASSPVADNMGATAQSESALVAADGEQEEDAAEPPSKRRRLFYKQPAPAEWAAAVQELAWAAKEQKTKKEAAKKMVLTTTGIDLDPEQRHFLKKTLKVRLVDQWSPKVTHLVADTFRRTTKLMCAVCTGTKIVSPDFIDACIASGSLVEDSAFILADEVCEQAFAKKQGLPDFSLQAAVERQREHGQCLKGISVHCALGVAGRQDLRPVVEAAGGKWLAKAPHKISDEQSVLLLAEPSSSKSMISNARDLERLQAGLFYSPEILREAACTQVLRRDVYRLSAPVSEAAADAAAEADVESLSMSPAPGPVSIAGDDVEMQEL